jgi:hypothetical protein
MSKSKIDTVIKKLQIRGIKPIRLNKGSKTIDPTIWITESIYIQANSNYVAIFKNTPNGLSVYESTSNVDDLMLNLKRAANNE